MGILRALSFHCDVRRDRLTESSNPQDRRNLDLQRRGVLVRGVVQGVGFRPFVYRLATEEGLAGSIGNDTDGVTIEVEGPAAHLDIFLERLRLEMPPLARIDSIIARNLEITGTQGFHIVASEVLGRVNTGIPADAATCPDCLRELLDPADRRFRYPFLNCTNCGPRFTITRRIPYDRPQTSMAKFTMCAACQAEYDDPLNRRFHAQPNACWDCGPRCWLESAAGIPISSEDPVQQTIDRLIAGEIVAIKGIGGFHLAVDATSEEAVSRLRKRKHRYGKPLAVMVRDMKRHRASANSGRRKPHCFKPRLARLCWLEHAPAMESPRQSPPESRGSASICPTHPCSICSLLIRA